MSHEVRTIKVDLSRIISLAFEAAQDETGIMCDEQYEVEIIDAEARLSKCCDWISKWMNR